MEKESKTTPTIEITADGSDTLLHHIYGDSYHSLHGAELETDFIYIGEGLRQCSEQKLTVLEVGFGTGLNALRTMECAKELGLEVEYYGVELYPVSLEIAAELSFAQRDGFMELHKLSWGEYHQLNQNFGIKKIEADLLDVDFSTESDFWRESHRGQESQQNRRGLSGQQSGCSEERLLDKRTGSNTQHSGCCNEKTLENEAKQLLGKKYRRDLSTQQSGCCNEKTFENEAKRLLDKKIDLVYFDAFAPSTQPELWSKEVFGKIYEAMNGGAILVTYSVMGSVRRALKSLGFKTERLEGPPGKRHILRATKPL